MPNQQDRLSDRERVRLNTTGKFRSCQMAHENRGAPTAAA